MEDTSVIDYQLINAIDCCFNIRAASRVISQIYDNDLSKIGLNGTQFTLLVGIASHEMTTLTAFSRMLYMDRSTLSRCLYPLYKADLIEKALSKDKRSKVYALTESGYLKLTQAVLSWDATQFKVISAIGRERYHELLKELKNISELLAGVFCMK